MTAKPAIGVVGALPVETVVELARVAEGAGFDGLWLNESGNDDSLGKLAAAAEATSALQFGVGVIPLDRMPGPVIAARIRELGVPLDRLRVGVGSGAVRAGGIALVREGVAQLRDDLGVRVVVGALGPRMRELAARESDGLVLSWLTPEAAADAMAELRAAAAGRVAEGVLYLRTIVDAGARDALAAEAARYAALPAYAANFERLGFEALDATLDLSDRAGAAPRLAAYRETVDELVFRIITPANDPAGIRAAIIAIAAAIR